MSINVLNVAKYLLSLADTKNGQTISNLALQKLLYYCQGYYLALTGEKLFPEDIVAWKYGPVVKEVYDKYKSHTDKPIVMTKDAQNEAMFSDEQKHLIQLVLEKYSVYSAYGLMKKTHNETPWQCTARDSCIQPELMQEYFTPIVEKLAETACLFNTKIALRAAKNGSVTEYKFGN